MFCENKKYKPLKYKARTYFPQYLFSAVGQEVNGSEKQSELELPFAVRSIHEIL